MTNVGYQWLRSRHLRKVQWFSNDPREVSENRTGSRSIWVRRGADRYPEGKRWAR